MRKLKKDPITADDLKEFVELSSDFAFEMAVLDCLRQLDFACSHSGTYEDPFQKKLRQYDLRAKKQSGSNKLLLAVECKNLRANFPLLISAVPRATSESFHDLMLDIDNPVPAQQIVRQAKKSYYAIDQMVGKQTDQVGRDKDGVFSNDSDAFEKLAQAINSAADVLAKSATRRSYRICSIVLPVVVVPAHTLWQTDYTAEGSMKTAPRPVQEATVFIDRALTCPPPYCLAYTISHLHVVTINGLKSATNRWLGPAGFFPGS